MDLAQRAANRVENAETKTSGMLAVFAPAGFEWYFEEVGRLARKGDAPPISREEVEKAIAAAPKHDSGMLFPAQ